MAKFSGKIGFMTDAAETSPGVWTEGVIEKSYRGDLIRAGLDQDTDNEVIDGVNLTNRVSIVADEYAYNNFQSIRYVQWMNARWKVTSIDLQHPRLILSLGGVWNGAIANSEEPEGTS